MALKFDVTGVVLAGGSGTRLGGVDKGLLELGGRTLAQRALERARPQVARLVLSANGDPARFGATEVTVIADDPVAVGPLGGLLAAMRWARGERGDGWLASFTVDAPFFPLDVVAQLFAALERERAQIACARSLGRIHPLFGVWPLSAAGELEKGLAAGVRSVHAWNARFEVAFADFSGARCDPFFNINRPRDLAEAQTLLAPPC